jgi:hypothetical protein
MSMKLLRILTLGAALATGACGTTASDATDTALDSENGASITAVTIAAGTTLPLVLTNAVASSASVAEDLVTPELTKGSSRASVEVLPAGTTLAVRTVEVIESTTAIVGQTFSAVVEDDVRGESDAIVIPAGSHADLVVQELSSGDVTGSPGMVLDMQSITVSGRRYLVGMTNWEHDSGTDTRANAWTADAIGGGAALGTIIGTMAGGSKSAAIGVLVSPAGGAGVQMLNGGKGVRVPVETLLTFTLGAPVTLQAEE